MNILTSNAHFRQRVIKKCYKVGVTEASKYYRVSRNAIYEWRAKYDGKSWKSLLHSTCKRDINYIWLLNGEEARG